MSCNYLVSSSMYTLGPIPRRDTERRYYQGLQPQLLSNNCAGCTVVNPVNKCITCKLDMYPAQQVHWNYGMREIPDNCTCVQYLCSP